MRRRLLAAIMALLCCGTVACISSPPPALDYLDEASAATITAARTPLVFARSRIEYAAHARDYVRLVAVDVNRSGTHEQWVLAYFQSLLDPRVAPTSPASSRAPDVLLVRADDRDVRLLNAGKSAPEVGIVRRVHAPKGTLDEPTVYRVDADVLAFIASAGRLSLHTDAGSEAGTFDLWSDGRQSLADFVQASGTHR